MASSDKELEAQLTESGNKLVEPPSSVDELLPLLDRVESYLSKVEQSPSKSMQDALSPSLKALVADELLRHSDVDVKVAVASCISEITRITAPEAPYDDDQMKDVFKIIVSSFENLSDKSSRSYIKRTLILETVAKVRSCVVMLDLECDALILEMFQHFLKAIRDYHPENVFTSMETIMTLVLEESEDIPVELLSPILASVKNENEEVLPIARRLGERVLESCAAKVKPYLVQAVKTLDIKLDDYSKVVATICGDADDNVERSEVQASDQNMAGESNSVKPSDYEEAKEDKGMAKEDASLEKTDPSICRSPQSAMSNGIAQTGGDDSLADSSSLKKQGDDHPIENSKDLDGSSNTEPNAEPDTMSAEKAVDIDQKPEQTIEKKESESSLSLKSTPSESAHADNANEKEALSGQGGQGDDVRGSPPEGPSAEVAEALEDDKGDNGKATSPKELENESAEVSSVSPSEDLPNESRSKKSGQKKKESLEKEAALSADNVSKNVADVTSDSEVKAKRRAGKKVPAASSCEIKVSTEIDASIKDRETTSDSEAKPLKHSTRKVVKSGKNEHGSAAKQAEDEKKQVEDSEATSDSDAKPLKQSAKKVDKSSKNEHGSSAKRVEDKNRQLEDSEATSGSELKSLKRSAKKVDKSSKRSKNEYGSSAKLVEDKKKQVEDSEATTDSEAKPLKLSARKLDRSSKNEHAKQVEDKKKQGRGKAASEKGVTKASAKDDSKDAIASPKLPGKSTKVEHSSEETPKTNSKRKRTPGKAKESGEKDFGENIVGSKVKVWWPKDHMFYDGVIVSFDPVKKKHNVLYTDGDFETLNLKREKWEFIGDDSGSDEEEVPGRSSPDASTELPLKKKAKTKSDEPPSKQKKVEASPKRTGVASSSKSKGTAQKSGRVGKSDGKSKDDSKSVGKSENASGGKSKDQTPRSGSSKSVTIALKSSSRSKNNDAQKPKTTKSKDESSMPSSKSKQDTLKAGKSKSSTPKTALASKDKPNQTSGKSSANGTGKVKSGSSKVKAEEDVKDNSSDSEKVPETTKGKSPNPSKGQEGDVQTGKKRRRVTKA